MTLDRRTARPGGKAKVLGLLLAVLGTAGACAPQSRADRAAPTEGLGGTGGRMTKQSGRGGIQGGEPSTGGGGGNPVEIDAAAADPVLPWSDAGAAEATPDTEDATPPVTPPPPAMPSPSAPPPPPDLPSEPDVTRGRNGHWRLDEGRGNVVLDSSPTGNHGGTINILDGDWQPAKRAMGIQFTPARRTFMLIADHDSLDPSTALSVAVWVRASAWTGAPRIVQKGEQVRQYALRIESGQLTAAVGLVGGQTVMAASAPPATGKWVHLALVYDGQALALFIDGVSVARTVLAGKPLVTTDSLTVAGHAAPDAPPSDFFAGLIDDLIVYGRALSATEVQQLVAARAP